MNRKKKERIAVYPGTFDPTTLGHLDVIKAGSMLFDEVIVAILVNVQKNPMFSKEERLAMVEESVRECKLSNVRVVFFEGLTTELVRQEGATVIIRGLRLVMDFEAELDISFNNRILGRGIPTIFIPPVQKHIHIRSATVRELLSFGKKKKLKHYVPPAVLRRIG